MIKVEFIRGRISIRRPKVPIAIIICFLLLLFAGLSPVFASKKDSVRQFTVLAINDVYRLDNLAYVRSLRQQLEKQYGDVLLLHAGDFLFPSLLSRYFNGEHMIDVLNHLDGDPEAFDPKMFIVFGNHEFDKRRLKHTSMLQSRIRESQFTWLNSNVVFRSISKGRPMVQAEQMLPNRIIEVNGVKVGLLGIVTDISMPEYVERFIPPEQAMRESILSLRKRGAEIIIAVTHLRMSRDKALLQALGDDGPDLIIGGHEHDRQTTLVNGRRIVKADADATTAAVVQINPDRKGRDGLPVVKLEFIEFPGGHVPDKNIVKRNAEWKQQFDQAYCQELKKQPNCLDRPLGKTQVALNAEELRIRRFETNLGNWMADLARQEFSDQGAKIALLNSGSMRLNQNIPAGSTITLRQIGTLFAYPTRLVQIKLTGMQLQQVLSHSVSDWTGNGHWLQVSGLAFRHDPDSNTADRLHLITESGLKPIAQEDEIVAVVNDYLINSNGGQDGYTMLSEDLLIEPRVKRPDLRDIVIKSLGEASEHGISPIRDGRICNIRDRSECMLKFH